MESILREWSRTQGEPMGVFVTRQHVCYWRGQREHPFLRMSLNDWVTGCQPRVAVFYVGQEAAEEVREFVQGLVDQPTQAVDGNAE